MKSLLLILFTMPLFNTLHAQPVKHISKPDAFNQYSEEYDVLKSDKKIRQGAYQYIRISDKKTVINGFYKNNLKDSTWLYIASNGDTIAYGNYQSGKRTGIWKYYRNKTVAEQYDFTNNKPVYHQKTADDDEEYAVISDHDTTYTHLDSAPLVVGGKEALSRNIARAIRYPADARMHGDIGQVIVLFTITADGKITNCHSLRPRVSSLDEAAIKTFMEVAGEWIPGVLNGKPVEVVESFPIKFGMAVLR